MRSDDRKRAAAERQFSLSNDQETALELLRLQEAAQLANDQLLNQGGFTRNNKLSHVVHAVLNLSQLLVAVMDEVFHHLHHTINRHLREKNPDIPDIPEERNPIFYVYPICMGISLILCILWLSSKLLHRRPIIALLGNAIGGMLIVIGGISAMQHAEKHINLNEVSDEELLTHPIFIHSFTICMLSIFGMILYLVPSWILFDVWQQERRKKSKLPVEVKEGRSSVSPRHCRCSHSPRSQCSSHSRRSSVCCHSKRSSVCSHSKRSSVCSHSKRSSISGNSNLSPTRTPAKKQSLDDEPIILYCCCVDCHRYIKASQQKDNYTHEFQVIQVM